MQGLQRNVGIRTGAPSYKCSSAVQITDVKLTSRFPILNCLCKWLLFDLGWLRVLCDIYHFSSLVMPGWYGRLVFCKLLLEVKKTDFVPSSMPEVSPMLFAVAIADRLCYHSSSEGLSNTKIFEAFGDRNRFSPWVNFIALQLVFSLDSKSRPL